jgi:hypothetical protein
MGIQGDRDAARAITVVASCGLAVILLPVAGALLGLDYFLDRNVIVAIVPFGLVVAAGANGRRVRRVGAVVIACLIGMNVATIAAVASRPELQKADWRDVASILKERHGSSLVILPGGRFLAQPTLRYAGGARVVPAGEVLAVSGVDIVSTWPMEARASCGLWFGAACYPILAPFEPAPRLADQLRLDQVRRTGQFAVARYVADEPVPVRPADLLPPEQVSSALRLVRGPIEG